jgi:hypothetical protein
MIHIHDAHGLTALNIGQREQLHAARPVYRQRQMIFPSMSDSKNPSVLWFFRLTLTMRAANPGPIATQSIGIISVQARGILPRPEEQSRTGGCQSGSVEDQPQCPGL